MRSPCLLRAVTAWPKRHAHILPRVLYWLPLGCDRHTLICDAQSADPGRRVDFGNPDYPSSHRGSLFVWKQITAPELFDYKALGYEYDALPTK